MAPTKLYQYTVAGRGIFPFDMLRHDACWPRRTDDALALIDQTGNNATRTVNLVSHDPPTPDRWASFGWHIAKMIVA